MLRFSRGGRPRKTGSAARPVSDQVITLKQIGMTKQQSADWRRLALIPEADFEELLRSWPKGRRMPSARGLWRMWMQDTRRRRPACLERMAEELRKAGWTVVPPRRREE
jgi:hypothetical protein